MDTRVEGTPAEVQSLLALFELKCQLAQGLSGEAKHVDDESVRRRFTATLASLPAGLAADFDRLMRRAHAPAVPLERTTHCSACHIRFAAQLELKVRNRSVIFACPRCYRLLYRLEPPSSDPKELARVRDRDKSGRRATQLL